MKRRWWLRSRSVDFSWTACRPPHWTVSHAGGKSGAAAAHHHAEASEAHRQQRQRRRLWHRSRPCALGAKVRKQTGLPAPIRGGREAQRSGGGDYEIEFARKVRADGAREGAQLARRNGEGLLQVGPVIVKAGEVGRDERCAQLVVLHREFSVGCALAVGALAGEVERYEISLGKPRCQRNDEGQRGSTDCRIAECREHRPSLTVGGFCRRRQLVRGILPEPAFPR